MEYSQEQQFLLCYAPYQIKDYVIKPRTYEEIPDFEPDKPYLRTLAFQVDQKRTEDPLVGAKLAGKEILTNLLNWMKTDRGVHAESLLAVLGALGGTEISRGIMQAAKSITQPMSLFGLGIMIVDANDGQRYLLGDRPANETVSFCFTAMRDRLDIEKYFKPLSEKTAASVGTAAFWDTPYQNMVGKNPKELAALFHGKFEFSFSVYTRFPQERMLAYAIAAQQAVVQTDGVLEWDTALGILSEYAWKTSHYIWGDEA